MSFSGRTSTFSSVIAVFCITVYIAAIAIGSIQIIVNIGERRNLAESEFSDLVDRASSAAVILGFMSEAYQDSLKDLIGTSATLMGVIITGSGGEFAFERFPGSGIVWVGTSPRFRSGFGFPSEPLFLPLRVEGQRNVTIQAVYSRFDTGHFLGTLRNTLLAVLAALGISFIALLIELLRKNRVSYQTAAAGRYSGADTSCGADTSRETDTRCAADNSYEVDDSLFSIDEDDEDFYGEKPKGLFSPRGNIGWESYTHDRLASELHRCASVEQDLGFLVMEFPDKLNDSQYRQFCEEAVSFFALRDLVFEKGEKGISVIIPNMELEQCMAKSRLFRNRIIDKLPVSFPNKTGLCIGISSRSGRLIEAERLTLEAASALEKAFLDPDTSIVAFKSDPEKYREYIRENL